MLDSSRPLTTRRHEHTQLTYGVSTSPHLKVHSTSQQRYPQASWRVLPIFRPEQPLQRKSCLEIEESDSGGPQHRKEASFLHMVFKCLTECSGGNEELNPIELWAFSSRCTGTMIFPPACTASKCLFLCLTTPLTCNLTQLHKRKQKMPWQVQPWRECKCQPEQPRTGSGLTSWQLRNKKALGLKR